MADLDLGFSVDARPDTSVKRQLSQKDGKARRKREQGQAEREAKLAKLIFQDESLVDELDEPALPKSKRRGRAPVQASEDGDDEEQQEEGEEGDDEEKGEEEEEEDEDEEPAAPKAAWVDEDDAKLNVDVMKQKRLRKLRTTKREAVLQGGDYEERLRAQWRSTQRNASWAAAAAADVAEAKQQSGGAAVEGDKAAALLRSAAPLLAHGAAARGGGGPLGAGKLSIKRVTDLNAAGKTQSIVSAVQWHPNGQLAMSAGMDKVVHLFRVDGDDNPQVQAVHVPRLQIKSAAFSPDGGQIYVCGERSTSWGSFDLHAGKMSMLPGLMGQQEQGFKRVVPSPDGQHLVLLGQSGSLLLLSAKTKQLVATLQPGSERWGCQCACFSPGGELLYAAGQGSQVQVWDVRRRCCVHTWHEQGGLRTTSLAASADGATLAAGSDSGAINLYGVRSVLESAQPAPLHELLNLQHPVSTLAFNHNAELLCFGSKYAKSALRVLHMGAKRVFPNWPTGATPLGKVECCAFSPRSGYMAAGNHQGKVLLYRLDHYPSA